MKYRIIDVNTGDVIRDVAELPDSIPSGAFVVENTDIDLRAKCVNELNAMAKEEILKGYDSSYGVHFDLSETDQLNYTAVAAIVNMGVEPISITGEKDGDKYFSLELTNQEAKDLLASIFSHVSSILSKYRGYKKRISSVVDDAVETEYASIMAEISDGENDAS